MKLPVTLICVISLLMLGCDQDKQTTGESQPVEQAPAAGVETASQPAVAIDTVEAEAEAQQAPAMDEAAPSDQPMAEAQPAAEPAMTGEQVFKKHCFACHMTGAANAPKVGDVQAWAPRIEKGMDALVMSALEGVPNTAMPPKGTCSSCTEDELKAAIEFMVNQSR